MKFILFVSAAILCNTSFGQANLQFNQVRLISGITTTVPDGKVWKVVNVYAQQRPRFTASSGTGSCGGSCNGATTRWNSFTVSNCPDLNSGSQLRVNGTAVNYNANSDLWLPAGTSVRGNDFNCNSSNNGFYDGTVGGVTYSCACPDHTPVTSVVSVLEFNLVE